MDVVLHDSPLSSFWNLWVMGLITLNIALLIWLVLWTQKIPAGSAKTSEDDTGHSFDGITELNNPLPLWWLYMLWAAIIFMVGYLTYFPGFGNVTGVGKWTQEQQLADEIKLFNEQTGPEFARLRAMSIADISKDEAAHNIGERLFANNCAVCHGSDAKGSKDFPNLTDNDWLYGGTPDRIFKTIMHGRGGVMPPYGGIPLDEEKLTNVANYVLSLSGRTHDALRAAKGKASFALCSACHGQKGIGSFASGQPDTGAPNLSDSIWLHGGSLSEIKHSIKNGFDGKYNKMPTFKNRLGEDRVRVLAAYIYSLSNK